MVNLPLMFVAVVSDGVILPHVVGPFCDEAEAMAHGREVAAATEMFAPAGSDGHCRVQVRPLYASLSDMMARGPVDA